VVKAHPIAITGDSSLTAALEQTGEHEVSVNSSHHQAIRTPGDNLRVVAVSPADGVIEAVELDAPNHFVIGVQWHPERTYGQSEFSRAIFSRFVKAAQEWRPPQVDSDQ
jgi:putative glutamine amidotransferase